MTPHDYLATARVPPSLKDQTFGPWDIQRQLTYTRFEFAGLFRHTYATIHLGLGECVMEDSPTELRQHLPIWLRGHGRVLVTGMGLGCVVRGLLANPDVEHIDVIEIDRRILDAVGPEFAGDDRVGLIHGDALAHPINGERWDFAWHDIWIDETETDRNLQFFHVELIGHFMSACGQQGAWKLPRFISRLAPKTAGLR